MELEAERLRSAIAEHASDQTAELAREFSVDRKDLERAFARIRDSLELDLYHRAKEF